MNKLHFLNSLDYLLVALMVLLSSWILLRWIRSTKQNTPANQNPLLSGNAIVKLLAGDFCIMLSIFAFFCLMSESAKTIPVIKSITTMDPESLFLLTVILFLAGVIFTVIGMVTIVTAARRQAATIEQTKT